MKNDFRPAAQYGLAETTMFKDIGMNKTKDKYIQLLTVNLCVLFINAERQQPYLLLINSVTLLELLPT